MITYRDLTSLDDFAAVVALESIIWGPGYTDVVPVPILAVSVHCGGVLIGAFEQSRMIGFVYSLPGIKAGAPTQWSHMLGVLDAYRSHGVGLALKELQRERTLAMGLGLIEWTFDPMQALNAHLNFTKLGVVVHEYMENVYGASTSPLHKGNPTDRFVAEWWIREARRVHALAGAVAANRTLPSGAWLECGHVDLSVDAPRVSVEIPTGFTEMLAEAPDLALAWRLQTRTVFTSYFARGFQAVAFFLDRPARRGTYLLVRS